MYLPDKKRDAEYIPPENDYSTGTKRVAEDRCNYPEYDEEKQDRIEKPAEKLIKENLGCNSYTQRDPRGFAIRMYLVDDEGRKWHNTWDGETTGLDR